MIGVNRRVQSCVAAVTVVLIGVLLGAPAWAQLPVSSDIVADTTWRTSDSPIFVDGSVRVQNGARLTIEAGVDVLMADGASLEILAGALVANGTALEPILITSEREVEQGQGSAAPGDWGSITFGPGTNDTATSLRHISIRYGSGLRIQASSPRLDYVDIRFNDGPAIQIDLAASPVGRGLTASDNQLDGILVVAGEMRGTVTWGLRGIPYVVAEGTVAVGAMRFGLFPNRLQMVRGAQAFLTLSIPEPAPQGGLLTDVVSNVPSVARVPDFVRVQEGEQTVSVQVDAETLGTTQIVASQFGYGSSSARIDVVEPPLLFLAPASAVVSVGSTSQMRVNIDGSAPIGGLIVELSVSDNSIATVVPSVLIPTGETEVFFEIHSLDEGVVTLTASAGGFEPGTARIRVRPLSVNLPETSVVAPGLNRQLPVTLTDPAPIGGLLVSMESDDPSVVQVSPSVLVPQGQFAANAVLTGVSAGATQVTASAEGYAADTSQVRVEQIDIVLLPDGEIRIPQGLSRNYRVRLSAVAPPGGVLVSLGVSDPELLGLSETQVHILEGELEATRTLRMSGLVKGETTFVASAEGLSNLEVSASVAGPAALGFFQRVSPVRLGKGLINSSNELQVRLFAEDGTTRLSTAEPVVVTLESSDPTRVSVPATVTIPVNSSPTSTAVSFQMTGLELTDEPVLVTASAEGYQSTSTPLEVVVITPTLAFQSLAGQRSTQSGRNAFSVAWEVQGAYQSWNTRTAEALSLPVDIVNAEPEGIVEGIYASATGEDATTVIEFGAGQNASIERHIGRPTSTGKYKVQVSRPGVGEWTSGEQFVSAPRLGFFQRISPVRLGKGLLNSSNELQVRLFAEDGTTRLSTAEPVVVTLESSDPTRVSVPATVTIPVNSSPTSTAVSFQMTGLELTDEPVLVTASAEGYQSTSTPLEVVVITPTLAFQSLAGQRSTQSGRNAFSVAWEVQGAYQSWNTRTAEALSLPVDIVNAEPEGIVEGIYASATGEDATTVIEFGAGQNASVQRHIGRPTSTGKYRVQVSRPGVGEWTSGEQFVSAPRLRFNVTSAVVGYGMRTYITDLSVQRVVNQTALISPEEIEVSIQCVSEAVCRVPQTVTIPANASSVRFQVTGTGLGVTRIRASAPGYLSEEELEITTVLPELSLSAFRTPTQLISGMTQNLTISTFVPGAARPSLQTAAESLLIDLVSAEPGVVSLPATTLIPQNASSSTAVLASADSPGTTTITASAPALIPTTSAEITVTSAD